jgi:hypothetical protein
MPTTTGTIGRDPASGMVTQYVPPNATRVATGGSNVVVGAPQGFTAAQALPAGVWQVISGGFEAVGVTQASPVTITPA